MIQEFTQEMKNYLKDTLKDVHTAIPGTIDEFNPVTGNAIVTPYGEYRKPDGTSIPFPRISNVPVHVMQGNRQRATIALPIQRGDECILFFSEQALDAWRTAGEQSDIDLRFDLTNAIALVGLFARPNPLVQQACEENAIIIKSGSDAVKIKNGQIEISSSANITVKSAGTVNITGTTVQIN